ncbi:hypothetical protein ACFFLE_11145, partial [Salinicoccus siamensis]
SGDQVDEVLGFRIRNKNGPAPLSLSESGSVCGIFEIEYEKRESMRIRGHFCLKQRRRTK